jgi:hypothetical protein
MKKVYILIFVLNCILCNAQKGIELTKTGFDIVTFPYKNGDTIEVLYSIEKEDKPALVFLQGSLPRPLVIVEDTTFYLTNFSNFDVEKVKKHYQVFNINMPFTPAVSKLEHLTDNALFVPDKNKPNEFFIDYQKANNLEYLTQRTNFAIAKLQKKFKKNNSRLVVMGHSQGAILGASLLEANKKITDFVFLSSNPYGRYLNNFNYYYEQFSNGHITPTQYDSCVLALKKEWINAKINVNNTLKTGDSPLNIISFSQNITNYLTNSKANIFIGYGTKDKASIGINWLHFNFLNSQKDNYIIKPYLNMEHNFFKVNLDKTDYSQSYWDNVIDDVVHWLYSNR